MWRLMSWKTPVRVDPPPLFAPCPTLLDLILNSATLVLSVAHKFKLTLCVDVGADLYAGCSGMYKVHAVESSSN